MNEKWDKRFLELAQSFARWSKDPSTAVGCCLVDDDKRILSDGYNGFCRGANDDPAIYADRPKKWARVIHAEANAVAAAARNGVPTKGATAYVTHPCCAQCAGLLIQAGVTRIVWPLIDLKPEWLPSVESALSLFIEAGWRMNSDSYNEVYKL